MLNAHRNLRQGKPTGTASHCQAFCSSAVESLNPPPGNKAAWVNDVKVKNGQKAVLMRSSEGLTAMLYIDPRTESLAEISEEIAAGCRQAGQAEGGCTTESPRGSR